MFKLLYCFFLFFFKPKTAYEMRISDWSSDVCSSDLAHHEIDYGGFALMRRPFVQCDNMFDAVNGDQTAEISGQHRCFVKHRDIGRAATCPPQLRRGDTLPDAPAAGTQRPSHSMVDLYPSARWQVGEQHGAKDRR